MSTAKSIICFFYEHNLPNPWAPGAFTWDALMVALYSVIAPKFQVCVGSAFIFFVFFSMNNIKSFGCLACCGEWMLQYSVFRFRLFFLSSSDMSFLLRRHSFGSSKIA